MANTWFRLYPEILHDPKVQILSETLRWRYVALLCLQCNDILKISPDDEIALSLRITVEEWSVTRTEFIKRNLLTQTGSIKGWEKRQFISDIKDPTASARQKRYRDSKRNERNANVTSRLPESDTDTDTEQIKSKTLSPSALAKEYGVDEQIAQDWITLRKVKKLPLTKTAIQGVYREAQKANLTMQETIKICCENGWGGFKESWDRSSTDKSGNNGHDLGVFV